MNARRLLRDAGHVIRRQWWIARGERQRIIEERDRYKAWGEQQFARARKADHALWTLGADCLPASVDTLRLVADEIDCDPGCEHVGPMDPSTGAIECPLTDRGECPFDKACELRGLADALETYASAIEARRAATLGAVHESAVAKPDAHTEASL